MRHTEQELLRVIDALYEGMLDEEAWQRALVKLTDVVSGSATALFSMNPSTGHVYRADVARIDHDVMQQYQQTWIHRDPRHAAALTCPVGVPQVDGMLLNMSEFHRSAIYNEFFRPSDIPYHIATWIERTATRGVVFFSGRLSLVDTAAGGKALAFFAHSDTFPVPPYLPEK